MLFALIVLISVCISVSSANICDTKMPSKVIKPCKCIDESDGVISLYLVCEGDMVTDETMENLSKNFEGYDFLDSFKLENTSVISLDITRLRFAPSVNWISLVNNSLLEHVDFTQFRKYATFIEINRCEKFRETSILNAINIRFSRLQELKVNGTKINRIPDYAFYNDTQSSLKTIEFKYNPISTIGKKAFYGLTEVTLIDLSHNQISFIDEEAFALNIDVQSQFVLNIDLRNNNLSSNSFINTSFSNIKRPVTLLLGNNNLRTLNESTFKPLLKGFGLTKIDLRNNPFDCDCSSKWIVELTSDLQEKILGMECKNGSNILDLKVNDFKNCN